jgi:hypothetical protein
MNQSRITLIVIDEDRPLRPGRLRVRVLGRAGDDTTWIAQAGLGVV